MISAEYSSNYFKQQSYKQLQYFKLQSNSLAAFKIEKEKIRPTTNYKHEHRKRQKNLSHLLINFYLRRRFVQWESLRVGMTKSPLLNSQDE